MTTLAERRNGQTTRLMEEAVDLLSQLPGYAKVFVTSPHPIWLLELDRAFRLSGLVGVEFYTLSQIKMGALLGKIGKLLIDDYEDFYWKDLEYLEQMKTYLECGLA